MLGHRNKVLIRPELDDEPLRRTVMAVRPVQQMHGLGADRGAAAWAPVADLLRQTGADWDRRAHRVSVLAGKLPASLVDAWVTRHPENRDALTLRAYVQVLRADKADAATRRRAETACAQAAFAAPDDPTPWIALLSLLRRHRIPACHGWPLWDEVVKRDCWNRTAHHEMVRLLSPRAGETSAFEMRDFADRRATAAPHGSPLALLPLAARAEHYAHRLSTVGRAAPELSGHWYGPSVTREIDAALDRWSPAAAPPHAQVMADLNILAFALTMTQRNHEAAPVFRRIGRHMTPFPWSTAADPVGTFMFWSARARR